MEAKTIRKRAVNPTAAERWPSAPTDTGAPKHRAGVADLFRVMPPHGAWPADLEALSRWLCAEPEHPGAADVQQALRELACWACRDKGAGAAVEEALHGLLAAVRSGSTVDVQASCATVRAQLRAIVVQTLDRACRQSCESRNPYAREWAAACASLLLTPEGLVDTAVFPVFADLLNQGMSALLPPGMRQDLEQRLHELIDPRRKLAACVDRLSGTQALHAEVDRLRRLQFGACPQPVRHQVGSLVLQLLLTPPRQPVDMGICWLANRNADILRRAPEELLERFDDWFERNVLVFNARGGGTDEVKLELYPVHALRWAAQPAEDWDNADSPVHGKLLGALQIALPGRSAAEWTEDLQGAARSLRAQAPITPMRLLRAVLMQHLNRTEGWKLSEDRLARPRQSPVLRDRAAVFEACLLDCLLVLEADTLNLLSAAWQVTASRHVKQVKLEESWTRVEQALRQDEALLARLPGMARFLAGLKALFVASAELDYERSATSGEAGFRLKLNLPGPSRRPVAILSVAQFFDAIERLAHELVKCHPKSEFARCLAAWKRQWPSKASFEQRLQELAASRGDDEEDQSVSASEFSTEEDASSLERSTEERGVWFLDLGTEERGDLAADPSEEPICYGLNPQVKSRYFVALPLQGQTWYWMASPVLDQAAPVRQSLIGLIRLLKHIHGKPTWREPFRQALHDGLGCLEIQLSESTDGSGAHAMTFKPLHPSFVSAWTTDIEPEDWIHAHLTAPMEQCLQLRMTSAEAKQWLSEVLRDCRLASGVDLQAAVMQALQLALAPLPGAAQQDSCRLSEVVAALRYMGVQSPPWFLCAHPQANGLSLAVLNHLPFEAPVAVYSDPNWELAHCCFFGKDVVADELAHFKGNQNRHRIGPSRVEFLDICAPGRF